MNKKKIFTVIGSILLAGVVLSIFLQFEQVEQYKTEQLKTGSIEKQLDFSASWYPVRYAKIALGAKKDIKKIRVKEGQKVRSGDVVAEMKDDSEYNSFKSAQSSYYSAIKSRNSSQSSISTSVTVPGSSTSIPITIPSSALGSFSQLQGSVNSAYYQMKNAELNLNNRKIKTPISGRVITVYTQDYSTTASSSSSISSSLLGGMGLGSVSTGSSDSPSGNYVIIVDENSPTFAFPFSEQEVVQISSKMEVSITSRVTQKEYKGEVTKVSRTPQQSSTTEEPTYLVTMVLKEYPKEIPYGGKLEGQIAVAKKNNISYLSYDAVTIESVNAGSVLALVDGKLERKTVGVGVNTDEQVEITSGISEKDVVVLDKATPKTVITFRPWIKNLFKKS